MTDPTPSERLTHPDLSRRTLLGGALAVGATAALGRPARAQAPRRGGHLIVGLENASSGDTLDPARFTGRYIIVVGLQLYDTVVDVDEQLRLKPALAESWAAKPGARDWVFKLRRGVTFHNGKEMTAADVVYSLNRHRGLDSKSAAKSLMAGVADVKATGKHEVVIVLEGGNADMPYLLADYHMGIGPEGSTFLDGTGTGPFILEAFQAGVQAQTKKNPNDWRTDRGFVDSVETLAINDPTARLSALQSGAVHLISRVDPKSAAALETIPQLQLFNVSGAGHCTFAMRCDQTPFDSNDVRLALKYAVDREAMVKTVLRGYGKIGNDQPIPSFDPFFAADIPQRAYDPDQARFHFRKAGAIAPIVLSVADTAAPGAVDAVQLFQATAAKAGITVQIDRVPNDGYWDNVWMKRPFSVGAWSGRPTADLMLSQVYLSDAKWNETFWKRPAFDRLLLQARSELDVAKRKQMYREMQLMIHEDGGAILPMFFNFLDAGSRKVHGFVPNPTMQMGGFRAPERVWLDA
jgi:peptide/nickel transport system substrate-binding protein